MRIQIHVFTSEETNTFKLLRVVSLFKDVHLDASWFRVFAKVI